MNTKVRKREFGETAPKLESATVEDTRGKYKIIT